MKIRLVSDLHIDINAKYGLDFKKEGLEDMFTVVAGDISGFPEKSVQWVKDNITRGALVSGNHDVYNADMPIEDVKALFAKEFPLGSDVTYFDNEAGVISKDIGENVLLVADVMYTDYKLPIHHINPYGDVGKNMRIADPWRSASRCGMNDFNYGTCKRCWKGLNEGSSSISKGRLVPEYYLEHHLAAFEAVTRVVESNSSKDIILVTHHCLSPKCIDPSYDGDELNASYVSNKEDWICAHPNIRCICSGHIHARKSFKIGENALYVMNALGYCSDQFKTWSTKDNAYVPWTPDCIIDTSSWTVDFKNHPMPEWESKYEKRREELVKIFPFLAW